MTKKQVGEERVYLAYTNSCNSSLKEVRTGTQTGQESADGSHGGVLLIGFLSMACSACFLTEPRTTSPGMAPQTIGWALPTQSLIKKMINTGLSTTRPYGDIFLIEVPSSQINLAYVKLT